MIGRTAQEKNAEKMFFTGKNDLKVGFTGFFLEPGGQGQGRTFQGHAHVRFRRGCMEFLTFQEADKDPVLRPLICIFLKEFMPEGISVLVSVGPKAFLYTLLHVIVTQFGSKGKPDFPVQESNIRNTLDNAGYAPDPFSIHIQVVGRRSTYRRNRTLENRVAAVLNVCQYLF
jgi:hypothetical protein